MSRVLATPLETYRMAQPFQRYGFLVLGLAMLLFGTALARDAELADGNVLHKVQSEETADQIAEIYGVNVSSIRELNESGSFQVGEVVQIPPAGSGWPVHRVQAGQTLWRIGKGYGIPVEQLMQANRRTQTRLMPGEVLVLPRGVKPKWSPPPPAPVEVVVEPSVPTSSLPERTVHLPDPPRGTWVEVRLPDDSRAWVRAEDLVLGAWQPKSRADLVSTARAFMGTPYKWGGTNPNGYDCSGFVQEVFRLCGHSVPRMADAQYDELQKVETEELEPGDLVFFNTDGSGVSHVGIYSGEGKFLHSSSSRGVVESTLSQNYYSQRYVGGSRVGTLQTKKKEPPSRFEDD
jgi:LysM repeat protein